jgi:type II secretory pathway pseudopilin PulG
MNLFQNQRKQRRLTRGTSLIEVLLTLVLVLALIGAAVISFNGTHAAAALREGAERFESLVQFARAEASLNGKKYRLVFTESTNETASASAALKVATLEVESDPIAEPGVFKKVTSTAVSNAELNNLVGVEAVKLPGARKNLSAPETAAALSEASTEGVAPDDELGCITFYPDGSSDSVEIILAPLDTEQKSRIALRISGVTGAISREFIDSASATDSSDEDELWDEAAAEPDSSGNLEEVPATGYNSQVSFAAQP